MYFDAKMNMWWRCVIELDLMNQDGVWNDLTWISIIIDLNLLYQMLEDAIIHTHQDLYQSYRHTMA